MRSRVLSNSVILTRRATIASKMGMSATVTMRRFTVFVCIFLCLVFFLYNLERIRNTLKTDATASSSSSSPVKLDDVEWKSIIRRKPVPDNEKYDRWIVLTTINLPTVDVQKLAGIKDWRVVVVGDTKTPHNWRFPNCVFLSVEKQVELGYKIAGLTPYRSYTRKNIGYLYAIEHGAKFIYETDDDNFPYDGKITFTEKALANFITYKTSSHIVNPYGYFGQSSIWPRGYPLDHIGDPQDHKFINCSDVKPGIQQGVVDGDPDIDAIFRLTRKDRGIKLDVQFDKTAPPIALPGQTMAPFNSQNTFFHENAFWSLLLPTTVAFRVTDIWRGYWAQRLLWDVGANLIFCPPNAYQDRSAHSYLDDFIDEKQLYHESGKLVEFLIKWKSQKPHFFSRILDLSIAMANEGLWDEGDARLTKAWLEDLISVGYAVPSIASDTSPCVHSNGPEIKAIGKEQPSSYLTAGKNLKLVNKL